VKGDECASTQTHSAMAWLEGLLLSSGVESTELQGDAALSLTVGGDGLDRIELLAVAERHLDAKVAFGERGTSSLADGSFAEDRRAVKQSVSARPPAKGALAGGHNHRPPIRSAHWPIHRFLNAQAHGEGTGP